MTIAAGGFKTKYPKIIEIARWCCLILPPFVALALSFLIGGILVLTVPTSLLTTPAFRGVNAIVFGASWVFFTVFPTASIAPRGKTVTALLFAAGINGYQILSKPVSPTWTYWATVMSMFVAGLIAVGLVYRRHGLRNFDRGWPAPLAAILRNPFVRRVTTSLIIGIGVALISMRVHREWGADPAEQFQRGFPFRITYGSKWSVGFNIDHLGFIFNSLLYGALSHIAAFAWRRRLRTRGA